MSYNNNSNLSLSLYSLSVSVCKPVSHPSPPVSLSFSLHKYLSLSLSVCSSVSKSLCPSLRFPASISPSFPTPFLRLAWAVRPKILGPYLGYHIAPHLINYITFIAVNKITTVFFNINNISKTSCCFSTKYSPQKKGGDIKTWTFTAEKKKRICFVIITLQSVR